MKKCQRKPNRHHQQKKKKRECGVERIIVGGFDQFNGLGENLNNENRKGYLISPPVKLSFDPSSLQSYSAYSGYSVLVMSDGSLKGIGNSNDGRISSTLQKTIIKDFTDFCIKDSSLRFPLFVMNGAHFTCFQKAPVMKGSSYSAIVI